MQNRGVSIFHTQRKHTTAKSSPRHTEPQISGFDQYLSQNARFDVFIGSCCYT